MLRTVASFLRVSHYAIGVGCRQLPDGVCVVSTGDSAVGQPEKWALLDFEGPTKPAVIRERIVETLGPSPDEWRIEERMADEREKRTQRARLSASDLFEQAGLVAPTFPRALAPSVARVRDWSFSSRDMERDPYDREFFIAEAVASPVDDYVAVAHSGHGVNSYAIIYLLVYGPVAIFAESGWGGAYMKEPEASEAVNEMLTQCGGLIEAVETRAEPLRPAPARLIVSDDNFTGAGGFCKWLDRPIGAMDDARRWVEDAYGRRPGRPAERDFPWLRMALEMLAASS